MSCLVKKKKILLIMFSHSPHLLLVPFIIYNYTQKVIYLIDEYYKYEKLV